MSANQEPNDINVSLRISKGLHEKITKAAERFDKDKAELLRLAIGFGLDDLLLIEHNEIAEIKAKIAAAKSKKKN
jgi:predicted DNA-binding protein